MDSADFKCQTDEKSTKLLQILPVLLGEVEIGTSSVGRNPAFRVEIPSDIVNHISARAQSMGFKERTRKLDHIEIACLPLSIGPCASSKRLNELLKE
ncbi:MAG: hypothetical protein LN413_06640 [Candidatus Thermoplasmatota archaeon]|nr:hypothetical protein [Candidatus Thermoplasmatota archaeon]